MPGGSVVAAPKPAAGVVIDGIDGKVSPGEYASEFSGSFTVENTPGSVSGGKLFFSQGLNYVDVAFLLPRELVDNTYGAHQHSSWSTAGKDHKFRSLLGSDSAQFIIPGLLDVTVDYLSGSGANTAGKGGKGKGGKGKGGKGKGKGKGPPFGSGGVTEGDASSIFPVETSMGFNFVQYGASHPGLFGKGSSSPALVPGLPGEPDLYQTVDSNLSGWVFDVTYELRIALSDPGSFNINNLQIGLVHVSPNKIGKNKVTFALNQPLAPIPVPSTLLLTSLGLLGMGAWRRLRRRTD